MSQRSIRSVERFRTLVFAEVRLESTWRHGGCGGQLESDVRRAFAHSPGVVFERHGFEAVTLADIAAASDVGRDARLYGVRAPLAHVVGPPGRDPAVAAGAVGDRRRVGLWARAGRWCPDAEFRTVWSPAGRPPPSTSTSEPMSPRRSTRSSAPSACSERLAASEMRVSQPGVPPCTWLQRCTATVVTRRRRPRSRGPTRPEGLLVRVSRCPQQGTDSDRMPRGDGGRSVGSCPILSFTVGTDTLPGWSTPS